MKKFKQFHSEQQYITEVGPFASAMMTAMAVTGVGLAGWKLFKTAKEKIKGYKETKAEKKQNPAGEKILVPVFNPDSGKVEKTKEVKTPSNWPSASGGGLTNKELVDFVKKFKEKADADKEAWDIKNPGKDDEPEDEEDPETTDDGEEGEGEKEDEVEKDKEGNIKNQDDAQAAFEKGDFKKAPSGWTKDPEDKTGKNVIKPEDIPKKPKKVIGTGTKGARTGMAGRTNPKDLKKAGVESKVLKFGEFITEGVMSDLLKASKSKKDSEITLDDGTDIPIDPLTSQILVKYIEGLNSSEKNRTIQQIQRTERAFMKVLGKAHENT